VTPRSTEFLDGAHRRLRSARQTLDVDASAAVSLTYCAMLSAARAALSERDLYAKTHAGTWHLFRDTFVATGDFDAELTTEAGRRQRQREQADYEAWLPSESEANATTELAERFVAAVEAMFA
jgi:uncharacterized protein (UPF0332 family)